MGWRQVGERDRCGGDRWGCTLTGLGCYSRSAGCLPGLGRARRVVRPPQGSFWGSAPLSAPTPPQPPVQKGGVRLPATKKPRLLPSQEDSPHPTLPTPAPHPRPHQTLQLPEGESEEVNLDDAAKDTSQTSVHPHSLALVAALEGLGTGAAGRALGPTCGRGWHRCHSRTAGPHRRCRPVPPARQGASTPTTRKYCSH